MASVHGAAGAWCPSGRFSILSRDQFVKNSSRSSVKRARLQGHFRAAVDAGSNAGGGAEGSPEVQDTLVKLLQLQVGAEKVKATAAEGSETLRQTAEEVALSGWAQQRVQGSSAESLVRMQSLQAKKELEKLRQVATDRSDLGFGSALVSDI